MRVIAAEVTTLATPKRSFKRDGKCLCFRLPLKQIAGDGLESR